MEEIPAENNSGSEAGNNVNDKFMMAVARRVNAGDPNITPSEVHMVKQYFNQDTTDEGVERRIKSLGGAAVIPYAGTESVADAPSDPTTHKLRDPISQGV